MNRRSTARKRSYNLYCMNFYGNNLNPIKKQFASQIRTGLRRTVFLIDLNDIQEDYCKKNEIKICSDHSIIIPESYLILSIQAAIKNCWQEYEEVSKKLEEETKFNLYEYFLKHIKDKSKRISGKRSNRKSVPGTPITGTSRTEKRKSLDAAEQPIVCVQIKSQEHNRIGQPERISLKKFILDDPTIDKLYIIIIGKMNESFYLSLLRHNLPLQGIMHYVPIESKYDQMLGNNKTHNFIMESLQKIGHEIYEQRQKPILKPVGIFTHNIPIISDCSAEWHSREIFDQLSWSIYDIEVLHQQYQRFYVTPFQETDVTMPSNISMQEFYKVANGMIVQGRYQRAEPPACDSDLATILFYLDSLLSASSYAHNILPDDDIHRMAKFGITKHISISIGANLSLLWHMEEGFRSVTKFNKGQRLFVEEANEILRNMWIYVDQNMFRDIYRSCLDYHSLRPYIMNDNLLQNLKCLPFAAEMMIFPSIVKLYLTEDSCCQRLTQLLDEYDDYFLEDLDNNNRLHTFRRPMNTILESQGLYVLPSCLCFRDFTLFQMAEFLRDLITPKMVDERRSMTNELFDMKFRQTDINNDTYVRPNSLKELLLQEKATKGKKMSTRLSRSTRTPASEHSQSLRNTSAKYSELCPPPLDSKSKSNHQMSSAMKSTTSILLPPIEGSEEAKIVGLPPDHPLLKGYNLEDIRQEIRIKTTKYHFAQGYLHFYEDFWCFTELNKNLTFCINHIKIYMQRPRVYLSALGISPEIRLQTRDNINLRILNEAHQCSRFIMQYPNGLTVHYHDTHAEQLWLQDTTPLNEQKRLMTPFGCVIVFYKPADIIVIMRYNGEVYNLYQYEFPVTEEEEEEEEEQADTNYEEEPQKLIILSSIKSPRRSSKIKGNSKNAKNWRKSKTKSSSTDQDEILLAEKLDKKKDLEEELKMAISSEMEFLDKVLNSFNLNYVHLVVTKADGRIIHFTSQGKIYEERRLRFSEWHDYFLDEAYVERSDGVKMIWCPEGLKCYHKDGTLIVTKLIEPFEETVIEKLDGSITKSSSHINLEEEYIQKLPLVPPFIMEESGEESHELAEEEIIHTYSWLMHHKSYAGVYIYWPLNAKNHFMEIYGVGNIRLFIERYTTSVSEDIPDMEEYRGDVEDEGIIAKVWIDNDLHLSVKEHTMILEARIDCYYKMTQQQNSTSEMDEEDVEKNDVEGFEESGECLEEEEQEEKEDENKEEFVSPISEFVSLKIKFMSDINVTFHYLINRIAETQANYNGTKTEELYFLQRILPNCKSKGFEFMEEYPTSGTYKTIGTNYILAVEKFRNIYKMLKHKSSMQKCDMEKFPRFRSRRQKSHQQKEFPWILSTSIYCQIPQYLRTNEQINIFVESLEDVDFKHLRKIMKNLLDQELYPEIAKKVRILWSTNNWRIKRLNNDKLIFKRQQRLGLYMAMLKHKVYPDYFKFMNEYRGKVQNIDFFDFTLKQCRNKEIPHQEVYLPKCEKKKSKKKQHK